MFLFSSNLSEYARQFKHVFFLRLEVWPGYITSVCENEGGLMLLADASHRVLRTQTVLEQM